MKLFINNEWVNTDEVRVRFDELDLYIYPTCVIAEVRQPDGRGPFRMTSIDTIICNTVNRKPLTEDKCSRLIALTIDKLDEIVQLRKTLIKEALDSSPSGV